MNIWQWIKDKLLTPANVEKAGKVVYDAAVKQADKMKHIPPAKKGLADPVSLLIVAAVGMVLGGVFGHGVKTRSITTDIRVVQSTNVTITVTGQRVEVSGSGGVSVPINGGGK